MTRKFDILTPIGLLAGLIVVTLAIYSITGLDGIVLFIQLASIFIVVGGVFAALLVNFTWEDLKRLPSVLREGFRRDEMNLEQLNETFIDLSTKARREGLLSLDLHIENEVEQPFIKKGIGLAVDGVEPEVIKDIMMAEVIAIEERHRKGRRMLEKAGEYAPAWGMVGTIVALVIMLNDMNDPAALGPSMALAMLTTLYGSLAANLFFNPLASKLQAKTEAEVFAKEIIIEGVIGVQSGQNPKILEEKLEAFVRKEKHRFENLSGSGAIVNEA
ncbi:flagellar motor protein MotP [Geomicrobium sp. JCM 19038]|uniref:flagellar motor protein MotP n=1 Tax=Geomicrobium sp. JCM 19038 TaxID=1460635 RepID=UPI00045F1722|nr:flagellar motor protein MotP [Geomicrobium sp. JCM 19038]GAK10260.1 flagellar motor rotation protein MotA [Geomicrobium sp. JCM 19038]